MMSKLCIENSIVINGCFNYKLIGTEWKNLHTDGEKRQFGVFHSDNYRNMQKNM